jgi:CheY-like chemotaxis protein
MNLAVNARDAMPDGGKLIIETSSLELDESFSKIHAEVQPGPYAMLAVSDNGIGMDEGIQEHIFEPFFTTKGVGKGTGLGLSTVYGIVQQSNGHIFVYSEPGKGTTFKIYFPQVQEPLQPAVAPPPVGELQGSECILLVEDEPALRNLAREYLEQSGYTVLEAETPKEAMQVSEQFLGPIEMLLTDVVMPEFNGRQLAEYLTSLRPFMKVLYMSGYTDTAIVNLDDPDAGTHFLTKPFSKQGLLSKVRTVLDSKEGSQLETAK